MKTPASKPAEMNSAACRNHFRSSIGPTKNRILTQMISQITWESASRLVPTTRIAYC